MAAEIVEGNYDLLFLILVRLPPKSVFRFRRVSKRWNNIFLHPSFLKSYSSIKQKEQPRSGGGCLLAFEDKLDTVRRATSVPVLAASLTPKMNILHIGRLKNAELGRFVSSSNGLILCGTHRDAYYVVNPLTGKIVTLPPPTKVSDWGQPAMALVCYENTCSILMPKYKVIAVECAHNCLRMEIYTPETGKWKRSTATLTESPYLETTPPLIIDGVIHWYGYSTVVIYDSSGGKNHAQCINKPRKYGKGTFWGSISRSSCNDALWYHEHTPEDRSLTFWMLPQNGENDRSYKRSTTIAANEWICMHTICYDSLFKDADDILSKHVTRKNVNGNSEAAASLLVPRSPNLVHLKVHGRIFLFDLVSGTLDKLVEYDGTPIIGHGKDFAEYYCDSYPYLESLALSSYDL